MVIQQRPGLLAVAEKFGLLADFGSIVVPADHVSETYLATFEARHQGGEKKLFWGYNDSITNKNFSNPTWVLKPGQRLWVRAHNQVVSGTTSSEERMEFLATLNSHHTGAQGAAMVFDQKRNQLPKGKWYASMDDPNRLWEDADRGHRVPGVYASTGGDFRFFLGYFEGPWHDSHVLLSFCDEAL